MLALAVANCTGGFDTSVRYRCASDDDCIAGYVCRKGVANSTLGIEACLPEERFTLESAELVADHELGRVWTRNGQSLEGSTTYDPCDSLELGGRTIWALPTIDQLRTLVDGCESSEIGGECAVTHECNQAQKPACYTVDSCKGCGDVGSCYWEQWVWGTTCPSLRASTLVEGPQGGSGEGTSWGIKFKTAQIKPLLWDADVPLTAFCIADLDSSSP
jgi:hypothetical protein